MSPTPPPSLPNPLSSSVTSAIAAHGCSAPAPPQFSPFADMVAVGELAAGTEIEVLRAMTIEPATVAAADRRQTFTAS